MIRSTRRKILLSLVALASIPAEVIAAAWQKLGERKVRLAADYDVIPVTAAKGSFRAIKLEVRENSVFINSVSVVYGNGAADDLPVRALISKGGETRRLDLRGGDRIIRSVRLFYRAVPNGKGQARVQVWGLEG